MKNLFIHLRQYSNYSLLQSSLKIDEIVELCKNNKMPAISLVDEQNMFGALEFSTSCSSNGIKPILGITCTIGPIPKLDEDSKLLFLVKNENGYKNLII